MRYKGAYRPTSILGMQNNRAQPPTVLINEQIPRVLNGAALTTNTGPSSIAVRMSPRLVKKGLPKKNAPGRVQT
jgi:hypothetical protein